MERLGWPWRLWGLTTLGYLAGIIITAFTGWPSLVIALALMVVAGFYSGKWALDAEDGDDAIAAIEELDAILHTK